jgi:hypothetical protein
MAQSSLYLGLCDGFGAKKIPPLPFNLRGGGDEISIRYSKEVVRELRSWKLKT